MGDNKLFDGLMLKKLRDDRKLSQFDLAMLTTWVDDTGKTRMVRPEQISKYESGTHEPSPRNTSLLARALGVAQEALSPAPAAAPMPKAAGN